MFSTTEYITSIYLSLSFLFTSLFDWFDFTITLLFPHYNPLSLSRSINFSCFPFILLHVFLPIHLSVCLSTYPSYTLSHSPLFPFPLLCFPSFPIYLKAAFWRFSSKEFFPYSADPSRHSEEPYDSCGGKWETNQALHTKWHIKIAATNNNMLHHFSGLCHWEKYLCLFIIVGWGLHGIQDICCNDLLSIYQFFYNYLGDSFIIKQIISISLYIELN